MTEWILTSSVLILVVIGLRSLLKDRLRPMTRYCLWFLVLLRLLIPVSLFESAISLGSAVQPVIQQTEDAVKQYEDAYDRIVEQHTQTGISATPAQTRDEVRQQIYADAYASLSDRYSQQGIAVTEQQLQQEAQAQVQTMDLVVLAADVLPVVWGMGIAVMALALLISNGWFSRKLHNTRRPVPCEGYPLPVYETPYPATPCLFGLVFPKVYLTPEAARNNELRRHALAHELTHFRHGDHVWSALRVLCLVIHWYNPLVWAAALLSRRDAELACDEATIRALGEEERVAYGKTLIGMTCVKRDPKSFLITATTMLGSKGSLKERVTAIARKPKNALLAVISCILILAIAAGCAFGGAVTEPDPGAEEPSTVPTGDVNGGLSRATVRVDGKLYIFLGGFNEGSVPGSYELAGAVIHSDPDHIPTEDLHGTLSVGTEIYVNPFQPRYIYYRSVSGDEVNVRQMERIDYAGYSIYELTGDEGDSRLPVIYPDTPAESPDHMEWFIYRDDPGWYLYDDLEGQACLDGYLYFRYPRGSGYAEQVSYEPVVCFTAIYNTVFYFTESGKLIQAENNGYPYEIIYTASGEPGDLAYDYPNLTFTDGETQTALDLTTGSASVIPTATEAPTPLPEDYTLADLVGSYEETLSWTEPISGHTYETDFSLPALYPFSSDAIFVRDLIESTWLPWLETQKECRDLQTGAAWEYVRYEAALNGDLLSLVIDVLWTASGNHDYQVYNFDLSTGALLSPADMAQRYLGISYPQFLRAVSDYRLAELQATQPNADMRQAMAAFAPEVSQMQYATVYLDQSGALCLHYVYLDLGGAMFFPRVTDLSAGTIPWDASSEQDAYAWLFSLYAPEEWALDSCVSDYRALLEAAYRADAVGFEDALALADTETRQQIMDLLGQTIN